MADKLFVPAQLGKIQLQNRIVLAPLTRFRATDAAVPDPLAIEYYSQRASNAGTLLITEATFISDEAAGYANVPGIWNDDQVAAWRHVTDAVHAKGSFIYCQLWSLGRVAKEEVLRPKGYDVTSASAISSGPGRTVPRPLTEEEIHKTIKQYAFAAKKAIEAGFDGVEIHSANGYLIDQFIQDVSNQRTDQWGGSIENRSRFVLSVAKEVVAAIGAERTGIRLSPFGAFQSMGMRNPGPQFSHVIRGLKELDLVYIHVILAGFNDGIPPATPEQARFVFEAWGSEKLVILAGQYTEERAIHALNTEWAGNNVAIAFGRSFLATPDLVARLKSSLEWNKPDKSTFYWSRTDGADKRIGYTDYPVHKDVESARI